MPQSLAKITVHLVFSTKYRNPLITDAIRPALHRYMAVVMQNVGCPPILINSVDDHIHILFYLGRTIAISDLVKEVKIASSRWIKTQGTEWLGFAWQGGYGAFSVSEHYVETVRAYIAGQKEHHSRNSFQDEMLSLLERHGVEYDERYVWD
ncbi:MAG TPA: IS200/IS605 family transposase [Armatimonadota bacterium]|jgi:REP element-mobilizing transposase RayT|nr:IS200/IS605 family transposase [Armatimonadota bacterium]